MRSGHGVARLCPKVANQLLQSSRRGFQANWHKLEPANAVLNASCPHSTQPDRRVLKIAELPNRKKLVKQLFDERFLLVQRIKRLCHRRQPRYGNRLIRTLAGLHDQDVSGIRKFVEETPKLSSRSRAAFSANQRHFHSVNSASGLFALTTTEKLAAADRVTSTP